MPNPGSCHGLPFWSVPRVPGWMVADDSGAMGVSSSTGSAASMISQRRMTTPFLSRHLGRISGVLRIRDNRSDAGGRATSGDVVCGDGEGVRLAVGQSVDD